MIVHKTKNVWFQIVPPLTFFQIFKATKQIPKNKKFKKKKLTSFSTLLLYLCKPKPINFKQTIFKPDEFLFFRKFKIQKVIN